MIDFVVSYKNLWKYQQESQITGQDRQKRPHCYVKPLDLLRHQRRWDRFSVDLSSEIDAVLLIPAQPSGHMTDRSSTVNWGSGLAGAERLDLSWGQSEKLRPQLRGGGTVIVCPCVILKVVSQLMFTLLFQFTHLGEALVCPEPKQPVGTSSADILWCLVGRLRGETGAAMFIKPPFFLFFFGATGTSVQMCRRGTFLVMDRAWSRPPRDP